MSSFLSSGFHLGSLAAAVNVGIMIFNKGFSAQAVRDMHALDTDVWSWHGQASVLVWAIAYFCAGYDCRETEADEKTRSGTVAAASHSSHSTIWLAFCIEKIYYVALWLRFVSSHGGMSFVVDTLKDVDEIRKGNFAKAFMAVYGMIDATFAILFFRQWSSMRSAQKKLKAQ